MIIGNGRMAKHMTHYLLSLKLDFYTWNRQQSFESLYANLPLVTHVLILISDQAIDDFIQMHLLPHINHQTLLIHFSGCFESAYSYSAHPLQTFSPTLYPTSEYLLIPFIIDDTAPEFLALLPGLPNPHYRINSSDKAFYHAHCVMANNFSALLWQKFYDTMQHKFQMKSEHLAPFLKQTFQNIAENPDNTLTGPLVRQDFVTLKKDKEALKNDPFLAIFEAFEKTFVRDNEP